MRLSKLLKYCITTSKCPFRKPLQKVGCPACLGLNSYAKDQPFVFNKNIFGMVC